MKNPKLIAAFLLTALVVVVFLQNRQPVEMNVLFLATVRTSLATALCGAFLVGALAGTAAYAMLRSRSTRTNGGGTGVV